MTKGRIFWWSILLILLAVVLLLEDQDPQVTEADDVQTLKRMVEVTGRLNNSNHQGTGLGFLPDAVVIFQRMDDDHTVAVRVDENGYYEVFLERGIYKVTVPQLKSDGSDPVEIYSGIPSKYLDVENNTLSVLYNIEIDPEDL